MKLFRKPIKEINPAIDNTAGKVAGCLLLVQEKWAAWMQGLSERLSMKMKIVMLILFITAGGTASIFHLRNAVSGNAAAVFKVGSISQPSLPAIQEDARISEQEFQKIERFRTYMDSLARSPSGKRKRDSLLSGRSGLMDSIGWIEERYREQQAKKGR